MFKRKYVFETRHTKAVRHFVNGLISLGILFFTYSFLCYIFLLFADSETRNADQAFYQKRPDAIIVFTGDEGRIPFAVKKISEYGQIPLFITGVYNQNTVNTLISNQVPIEDLGEIDPNIVEIDYVARNTFENVVSSLRYLREKKNFNKILLISHDYHLMRIKLILNELSDPNDEFQIYFHGIRTNYLNPRHLKILYTEVFKLIRTYFFMQIYSI